MKLLLSIKRDVFGFSEVGHIADRILERATDYVNYDYPDRERNMDFYIEMVSHAFNDEIIYYSDQWEILKHYINPTDINDFTFEEIMNYFFEDIIDYMVVEPRAD